VFAGGGAVKRARQRLATVLKCICI